VYVSHHTKALLFVALRHATFRVPAALFVMAGERWAVTPGNVAASLFFGAASGSHRSYSHSRHLPHRVYIALDKTLFRHPPQWQFLSSFRPVQETKKGFSLNVPCLRLFTAISLRMSR